RRIPLAEKVPYDPMAAKERAEAHAEHFASLVIDRLREYQEATGRTGVVVAPFDTELFGHWWFEGPQWLESVLRRLEGQVEVATASSFLAKHPPRSAIRLPEGSWGQGGHHWVWLNDGTRWIWEEVYRAEDAFLEASRAARGQRKPIVRRILTQLARELLLLESSDWPFLITTVAAKDYAEARVKEHIGAFDRLRSMLPRAKDGTLSPEDLAWLATIEARDSPFSVLGRAEGSASIDIEPQTLTWLLERDPSAYREIVAAYDAGTAGFVMTPPFHPILPHLHRQEREALFDMMIDFYSPLIRRSAGRPIGLWLPEACYSRETMDSFREATRQASLDQDGMADSLQAAYLVADGRQLARLPEPGRAWIRLETTDRVPAIVRDHSLSGEFAFGDPTDSAWRACTGTVRCPSYGSTPSPWRPSESKPRSDDGLYKCSSRPA